ncbi:Protein of unknown function DUF2815 like protein [Aduncisulcus paluster]|uniref:DUF2815 family protein n=1 Tax=Aduncisulcus paluster TaxID=2918883 RepID=A0ABQ5KLY0_9EUKA|nr:Protein of unknown function DUF2815 like protein [Aduncisulcus paluster]
MANTTLTPIGTICFPALFEPKKNKQNPTANARYSLILLFDDTATQTTAYQDLRKMVHAAIEEKWGAAKAADPAFVRSLRLPFRNASEKDYNGFDKGTIYISPWSNGEGPHASRPDVVNLHGDKIVVPEDVWAGQLGRASVRAFGYDSNGNKGVALGLEHVQIVKADCERLDGKQSADKAFAGADNSQLAALGIDPNATSGGGASNDDFPF